MKPVIVEEIEFYVSDSGETTGMSLSGLARLCGVNLSTIQKYVSNLEVTYTEGFNKAKIIPIDICKNIVLRYTAIGKGTNLAYQFLNIQTKTSCINKYRTSENKIKNKLYKQLGGQKEVITLAGNIDLLTTAEIIEIKRISNWKHALGQVLVYSVYYPSHQKRIHLFGETTSSYVDLVKQHCEKFNVKVTSEV